MLQPTNVRGVFLGRSEVSHVFQKLLPFQQLWDNHLPHQMYLLMDLCYILKLGLIDSELMLCGILNDPAHNTRSNLKSGTLVAP